MIYYEYTYSRRLYYYYICDIENPIFSTNQYMYDAYGQQCGMISAAYFDELPELFPIYLDIKNEEI